MNPGEQLLAIVTQYRATLRTFSIDIKNLKKHAYFSTEQDDNIADRGEMIANLMLAYRHLEDARMRLGKVFEAYKGEGIGDGPIAK